MAFIFIFLTLWAGCCWYFYSVSFDFPAFLPFSLSSSSFFWNLLTFPQYTLFRIFTSESLWFKIFSHSSCWKHLYFSCVWRILSLGIEDGPGQLFSLIVHLIAWGFRSECWEVTANLTVFSPGYSFILTSGELFYFITTDLSS